jgi:hypothetical protein
MAGQKAGDFGEVATVADCGISRVKRVVDIRRRIFSSALTFFFCREPIEMRR